MTLRTKLTTSEIEQRLGSLPGWALTPQGKIAKTWKLRDFKQALGFIVRIGLAAEAMDHHPEIINVYNTVSIALSTHDAKGLTELDFKLAEQIEALA